MSKSSEYIVVKATAIKDFEDKVNQMQQSGYVVCGSMAKDSTGFYQSMTLDIEIGDGISQTDRHK